MSRPAHLPQPQTWACGVCGAAWPCGTARTHLLRCYEGARMSLHVFMAGYFVHAAQELAAVPAGELWVRFMGWVPR